MGITMVSATEESVVDNEYLMSKAQDIIDATGTGAKVKHVNRFLGKDKYGHVRAGVVKAELQST